MQWEAVLVVQDVPQVVVQDALVDALVDAVICVIVRVAQIVQPHARLYVKMRVIETSICKHLTSSDYRVGRNYLFSSYSIHNP